MKFLYRVKIFIVLLLFILIRDVFALYRLADRAPSNVWSILGARVDFGTLGNVAVWIILAIWVLIFAVFWIVCYTKFYLTRDDKRLSFVFSSIFASFGVASPYLLELSTILGLIALGAVILFILWNLVRGVKKVSLKTAGGIRRFGRFVKVFGKLKHVLEKLKHAPDKDEEDYEGFKDEMISTLNTERSGLVRLRTKYKWLAEKYRKNKAKRIIHRSFDKAEKYLEDAIHKLRKGDPYGSYRSAQKAYRLRARLERVIVKLERAVDRLQKSGDEKDEGEIEPGEQKLPPEGEKPLLFSERAESAMGDEEVEKEPEIEGGIQVGRDFTYITKEGRVLPVRVKIYPSKNEGEAVVFDIYKPNLVFRVPVNKLEDIEVFNRFRNELVKKYNELRKRQSSLSPKDPKYAQLDEEGRDLISQLKEMGYEFN